MPTVTLHAGTVTHDSGVGSQVGTGAIWDDASDSTYIESSTTQGSSSGGTVGLAPLDVLSLPDGATVSSVTVNLRAASLVGTDTPARVDVGVYVGPGTAAPFDGTYVLGVSSFSPSGGWQIETAGTATSFTHTFDDTDFSTFSSSLSALVAVLQSGADVYARSLAVPGHTGLTVSHRYYELSLTVAYDDGTVQTPCNTVVDLDLSTAAFFDNAGTPTGTYADGVIFGDGTFPPDFYFPLDLDATKPYQVTVTFDPTSPHATGAGSGFVEVLGVQPGNEQDNFDNGPEALIFAADDAVDNTQTFVIGPGRSRGLLTSGPGWDDATSGVVAGYNRIWFETDRLLPVSAISIRKICSTVPPPLRLTNRDDQFASARRMVPSSRSRQGSNRMTGYL